MKHALAVTFRGYLTAGTTGHATRSTTGAMHFDVDCHGPVQSVLKPVNSHSGPKLLVNELVCSEIAFRLGLPCLEPMIVHVPPELRVPLRLTPGYMRPGPNYAVPYLDNSTAPPTREHITRAENLSDLLGVIVFDAWIANRDRTTPGNLLAVPSPQAPDRYRIWIIDHGHGLTGPDWTAQRLDSSPPVEPLPYLDVFDEVVSEGLGDLQRWIARIEGLTEDEIAEVVALVPPSWLPDPADQEALIGYLYRRRLDLDRVLAAAAAATLSLRSA